MARSRQKYFQRICLVAVTVITLYSLFVGNASPWLHHTTKLQDSGTASERRITSLINDQLHDGEKMLYNDRQKKTAFKLFIYDLPKMFNNDLIAGIHNASKFKHCYELDNGGMGPELFKYGNKKQLSVRNTNQFSLEIIIHNKLLTSPYRTNDPNEADVFYIPAYIGLACILYHGHKNKIKSIIQQLLAFLKQYPYFGNGRPHVTSIGHIMRELALGGCPYLLNPEMKKVTFMAIEKEYRESWLRYKKIHDLSVITAPYPSYVHVIQNQNGSHPQVPLLPLAERRVFVFLASGSRKVNDFRANITTQMQKVTRNSYEEFYNLMSNKDIKMVKLQTDECDPTHKWTTIPWMQHSVFCLQPPGDSPTRKSFYDAVLSGCIPVLFPYPNQPNMYPFQDHFNYSQFTVTVPYHFIVKEQGKIYNFLTAISAEEISLKLDKLKEIAQWFQYSLLPNDVKAMPHHDAVEIILDKISKIYHLSHHN